jgi:hypothetical protein
MHFFTYTPQRERFIALLWGLLFAKCFIVEHYVQAYAVPVNSLLYVWALSISMATVATVAFWRLRTTEGLPPRLPRALLIGWVLCLSIAGLLLMSTWIAAPLQLASVTVACAVVLGCGYAWQGMHTKAFLDWFSAGGWWLMAAAQLFLSSEKALLTFGFGLLGFVVVPLACRLLVEWKQGKAAVRALYIANDI